MPIRIHSYALNSRDVHTTVSWTPQFGCFHWHLFGIGMKTDLFQSCGHCWVLLFMGFSRQEYWSGLPFPSPVDHILSDLSTMTRPSWVVPRAWLSFIELDKAVVLVWLDWLVFCDYGFSVSALRCPLATPTILLGFLLPWVWGISSRLLQQSTALPWTKGISSPPPFLTFNVG